MIKKVPSRDLRAYIVWIPILASDHGEDARRAAARFTDPRVTHYWDAERALGHDLGRALSINPSRFDSGRDFGVAWDVYLLYPRGARWGGAAPAPAYWMHQLRQVPPERAPTLDPAELLSRVQQATGGAP